MIRPTLALPASHATQAIVRVDGADVERCKAALASGDAVEIEGFMASWKVVGYSAVGDVHSFVVEPLADPVASVSRLLEKPDPSPIAIAHRRADAPVKASREARSSKND